MVALLLIVGILVAAFVGFNIGGSSTGVAFGPAVGSRIVGKLAAGGLFTAFALLGGWTVGRNVVETMGGEIVPASQFTLEASVVVLFFTGFALLVSNLYGVPASTSMTAVGAIIGLGLASGTLDEELMFEIVSAWIISPLIAFWVGAVIGRYFYPYLDARFAFNRIEGDLLLVDRSGTVPKPALGEAITLRDLLGALLVLVIACYMAFSAGASNVANAVAPLVGSGIVSIEQGILLGVAAIGLGAVTIARRTLDTVSDDLTDLPILAALIVSSVSATVITILSQLGIPASLAVSTTMCIVGLGWGRASRTTSLADAAGAAVRGESGAGLSAGALATEGEDAESKPTVGTLAAGETVQPARKNDVSERPRVPRIGEEEPEELVTNDLFDPATTGRVMVLWVLTPTLSALGSYVVFEFILLAGS
jgi:PiT family inorganic phosphate transporter